MKLTEIPFDMWFSYCLIMQEWKQRHNDITELAILCLTNPDGLVERFGKLWY